MIKNTNTYKYFLVGSNFKKTRMKKIIYTLISFLFCLPIFSQIKTNQEQKDLAFYNNIKKWFSTWELAGKEIYKIDIVKPVDFIFFDDKYVYSTSNITVKNGTKVNTFNLKNLKLRWKKILQNGLIKFPDNSVVPVNLMSFTSEIPDSKNKSFFGMPLTQVLRYCGF